MSGLPDELATGDIGDLNGKKKAVTGASVSIPAIGEPPGRAKTGHLSGTCQGCGNWYERLTMHKCRELPKKVTKPVSIDGSGGIMNTGGAPGVPLGAAAHQAMKRTADEAGLNIPPATTETVDGYVTKLKKIMQQASADGLDMDVQVYSGRTIVANLVSAGAHSFTTIVPR